MISMIDLEKARQSIDEIDREMARLYEMRMNAVRLVADHKQKNHLTIKDTNREEMVIRNNTTLIANEEYRPYYLRFLRSVMENSKEFQRDLISDTLYVKASFGAYPIHFGHGLLQKAGELLNLNRKVLLVTDTGVPEQYVMTVASQCDEAIVFVFQEGENSKNVDTYIALLQMLTDNHFSRTDCIVAIGGGVVGDVAGFAASTYMRGVDFYNIPTTVLSQVDASVGGKTAIDFMGYKNLVGSFYPPKAVLIDPMTLTTLPQRHVSNGLAEVVKMALTHDQALFELFEKEELTDARFTEVIYRAIRIKKQIVEADEFESNQRKVLNFGHTLGHGIEAVTKLHHGECVALGMLPMCAPEVRQRLLNVMKRLRLPTFVAGNARAIIESCQHDKKRSADSVTVITVPKIGRYELKTVNYQELEQWLREVLDG